MRIQKIGAVLLLALGGCGDLLTETPESFLATDNFYRTPADLEAAIGSVYRSTFGSVHGMWVALEAASDQAHIHPRVPTPDVINTGTLAYAGLNSEVTGPWTDLYRTISRANLLLDRGGSVEMPAARRDALLGEARFLRALAYFYLVRLYGDVPLVTGAPDPALRIGRSPAEEVYAQILQDLQAAVPALPLRRDAANAGRATRGAALALLADVHLTRGDWQKAADAARQVINLNEYSLHADFLRAFLPAHENGMEDVFSLQAEGPPAVGAGWVGRYFPREIPPGLGGGGGTLQPTRWQLDAFHAGDYRREVTYRADWVDLKGKVYRNLYPHVFKYRPTIVTSSNEGDVNVPVYRYAEVLLIHAEALNELGRTGEAVQYLNRIRARARNADGEPRAQPADYDGPMSQAAVREAILMERSRELAHEAKRWFDLVRRGDAYFVEQIAAHDPEATDLQPTDRLWPIPQSEIDRNPLIQQNAGY